MKGLLLPFLLHILTGLITLSIALLMGLGQPVTHSGIVEIDTDEILRRFIHDLGDEVDKEQVQAQSAAFMGAMQRTLDNYAARNSVIVVEARLSVAGAVDISERAYAEVSKLVGPNVAAGFAQSLTGAKQ